MAAVDELKDNPAGKLPDVIEYVIASPSGSVAAAEESVYEERVLSKIVPNVPEDVVKTGVASETIQFSNTANNPDKFVTFISYGSYVPLKELLFTVVVITFALVTTVVRGDTSPPLAPTNKTTAPAENKLPLITIVFIDDEGGKKVLVTGEPPSTVKFVIVGGASIAFHSVPV